MINLVDGRFDGLEMFRELLQEYGEWLGCSCKKGFEEEVAGLPWHYSPPMGVILVAEIQAGTAGCVALRPLSREVAEVKRLYVRPAYRTTGVGRVLMNHLLLMAKDLGYKKLVLDTLPDRMQAAISLYKSLGFVQCGQYLYECEPGSIAFELEL